MVFGYLNKPLLRGSSQGPHRASLNPYYASTTPTALVYNVNDIRELLSLKVVVALSTFYPETLI